MTKKLALLGASLKHSKSHLVHQALGRLFGYDIEYHYLEIQEDQIPLVLNDLKNQKFAGFTVTIPYKESVIPYLDRLTPRAKAIKAVNTIWYQDNLLWGDNTDYDGFLATLRLGDYDLKHLKPIILGSGGAAKAVYQVLIDLKLKPIVVSRGLSNQTDHFDQVISYDDLKMTDYNLIINATPVGMGDLIGKTPLEADLIKQSAVIDLIYNPRLTALMMQASSRVNGLTMLIVQAIYAQKRFFQSDLKVTKEVLNQIRRSLDDE